ncbi:zf-HC2 domain-containing protein [Mycolicibacterium neoaurum]|uniref:zf-HC2 domain-containing protein n=1 Tax=Mycolicibacterium neoaurum TaxID=1795 RepID=UPI0026735AFE|nr:zf-HC2 domain-containing protein [Mycolicibacterium neoaurum]MDO3400300.1 zf-HC2 domain-containing protein [Mycolicibacterium neoaurum]
MSENEWVDCGVAREALSARLDGEREAVPSHRVDEHLETCVACAGWYRDASRQAILLRTLTSAALPQPVAVPEAVSENLHAVGDQRRWTVPFVIRWVLGFVGATQLILAGAQLLGVDFGVVSGHHGAANGMHLLNESTAWSAALGIGLIAAAIRPVFAAGVACVAAGYALGLVYFVTVDALTGHVTPGRAASHLPVIAGAMLALTVWRATTSAPVPRSHRSVETKEESTDALSQRRRTKDLRASDDSAA